MEGLRLLFVFVLTVATVTGLQNVVQYEMEEVSGIEPDAVGSWWRRRVNMIIAIYILFLCVFFSNATSRFSIGENSAFSKF